MRIESMIIPMKKTNEKTNGIKLAGVSMSRKLKVTIYLFNIEVRLRLMREDNRKIVLRHIVNSFEYIGTFELKS